MDDPAVDLCCPEEEVAVGLQQAVVEVSHPAQQKNMYQSS